jgi:hypothetical protein
MSSTFRWFTVILSAIVFLSGIGSLIITWTTLIVPINLRLLVSGWICVVLALSMIFGISQYKALMLIRMKINRKNFIVKYPRNSSR